LDYEHNDGDDQKDMNDATHRVATHQSQKPQNKENHTYRPKHASSSFPLIINCKPDYLPLGSCEKMGMAPFAVIPAETGIQKFQGVTKTLDPCFHWGDGQNSILSQLLAVG
jgi:hypothetical protein